MKLNEEEKAQVDKSTQHVVNAIKNFRRKNQFLPKENAERLGHQLSKFLVEYGYAGFDWRQKEPL